MSGIDRPRPAIEPATHSALGGLGVLQSEAQQLTSLPDREALQATALQIGRFQISRSPDAPSKVWIFLRNGEGGRFDEAGLEQAVSDFFNANF